MSSFKEAVEEWNRRNAEHGGYRSSFSPTLECPNCHGHGAILSTIFGATKATCNNHECKYVWEL